MMREYLFRGKRKDNGKWVYGFPYIDRNRNCAITYCEINFQRISFEVIPETIGQFIGLCDINGKKIFEGDIFKFEDEVWQSCYTSCGTEWNSWEVENCGVVGFNEELSQYDFIKYRFGQNSVEADLHENHDMTFADFITDLEIVGNIYDHPELMEDENTNER